MKLYEIPRGSFFKITEENNLPILKLHNLDGMYSYCTDSLNNVMHIYACAEVVITNDFEDKLV